MDADGIHEVSWKVDDERLTMSDNLALDAVYIAAIDNSVRDGIVERRQKALDHEATNPVDIDAIRAIGK